MSAQTKARPKGSGREKAMGAVERVGNLLPHPFWLFALLGTITVVLSAVLSAINWSASYETVVDGVLQRSQFMRKPDSLSKMATAFMAEPTKTYNQFMGAVYDLQQAQKPKERVQAMRRMGRTCFALTASIVVNAAVGQAFIDALI